MRLQRTLIACLLGLILGAAPLACGVLPLNAIVDGPSSPDASSIGDGASVEDGSSVDGSHDASFDASFDASRDASRDASNDGSRDASIDSSSPDAAPPPDASSCPPGETLCDGICVDTSSDGTNCGTCDSACGDGATCQRGACLTTCLPGETPCGASCLRGSSDAGPELDKLGQPGCGGCEGRCGGGAICWGDACVCPPWTSRCGDACVDLRFDLDDCGACGAACGEGQVCIEGVCL